jgi:hypothetical protein
VVSVKRLTWQIEILDRAKKSLADGRLVIARSRLDMALHIAKELLKRAQAYQKRDAEKKK